MKTIGFLFLGPTAFAPLMPDKKLGQAPSKRMSAGELLKQAAWGRAGIFPSEFGVFFLHSFGTILCFRIIALIDTNHKSNLTK